MNFFSIVNKKTGEKGQVLDYSEGEIGLRTDQDDLEIHLYNGLILPIAIIEPVLTIQEHVNKIKEGFGLE